MRYSELIKELDCWKKLSREENPEIIIADSYQSYEFLIKNIFNKIGIFINAQ